MPVAHDTLHRPRLRPPSPGRLLHLLLGCALLTGLPGSGGCLSLFSTPQPSDGPALPDGGATDAGPLQRPDLQQAQDGSAILDLEPPPSDLGEDQPDLPPPPPPPPEPCPAVSLFCGALQPGCWQDRDCPGCPLTGCHSDVPAPQGMVVVQDECGHVRLTPVGADPRLSIGNVGRPEGQYPAPIGFDLLVDDRPVSACTMQELPTGALRYEVVCSRDAVRIGTAVLEPDACPACPAFAGCFGVHLAALGARLSQPAPDELRVTIVQQDCSLWSSGPALPPYSLRGWVEPDGLVTLQARDAMGLGLSCLTTVEAMAQATPLDCTIHSAGRPDEDALGWIERRPDAECGER